MWWKNYESVEENIKLYRKTYKYVGDYLCAKIIVSMEHCYG